MIRALAAAFAMAAISLAGALPVVAQPADTNPVERQGF